MSLIKIQSNKRFLLFSSILLLVFILFLKPLSSLFRIWLSNPDYSHGFFVVPISVYMTWTNRVKWQKVPSKASPAWAFFFFFSVLFYLLAVFSKIHTLIFISMVLLLICLLFALIGWQKGNYFLIPILFLFFMFPIPSSAYILMTNPLKLFITSISAWIIRLFDIPVFQQGNLLFFSNTRLEVAEACSGIRSIYSYLMISIVYTVLTKDVRIKLILILSSIPLAIFVNILRVTLTGILSHHFGEKIAQGFFHEFTGIVLFFVGFIFMLCIFSITNFIFKNLTD